MALFRAISNAQYILSDSPFAVSWCKPYLLARPISSASIIYRKYLVQRHAYYLLDNAVSEIMTCIVYMLAAVFDQEIDKLSDSTYSYLLLLKVWEICPGLSALAKMCELSFSQF